MNTAQSISDKVADATGSNIDPKFFNTVAQFAHFGMMFTVTTICITVFSLLHHRFIGEIVGGVGCLIYAAIHEFIWDPREENAVTRGSDLQDFIFLVAGSMSALLVGWLP